MDSRLLVGGQSADVLDCGHSSADLSHLIIAVSDCCCCAACDCGLPVLLDAENFYPVALPPAPAEFLLGEKVKLEN